jgi:glycosyltransferase involved in cell wall biosynthesis
VHAHDVNTLPTAWLASKFSGSPLVYDAHEISTDREGYASFRKLVGWVEKYLAPRSAAMITTTDTRAKFFARAYGVPRPLVLQNRPRFIITPRTSKIRDELGLRDPWPIVLYQGGLQQGRGLPNLIRAACRVKNAYFVFIGGGRLELELKSLVQSLGLDCRVFFIPTVPLSDLPVYTASADLGVQPIENTCLNHYSTDSNKLFEYMMAGLPVVATSMPEIRKLVGAYDFGTVVEPDDVEELAIAIQMLVDSPEIRAKMSENALRAAKQINWEEQEEGLLEIYQNILQLNRR